MAAKLARGAIERDRSGVGLLDREKPVTSRRERAIASGQTFAAFSFEVRPCRIPTAATSSPASPPVLP